MICISVAYPLDNLDFLIDAEQYECSFVTMNSFMSSYIIYKYISACSLSMLENF